MGKRSDRDAPKGAMPIEDILRMEIDAGRRGVAPGAPAEGGGRGLKDTVTGVAQMLRDLEAQLARVMAVNDRLEKELGETRAAARAVARERDELVERLGRTQDEGLTLDDVRGELVALQRERRELAERLDGVEDEARRLEAAGRHAQQALERMTAERDDAREEVRTLEAQFGRAMQAVAELRRRCEDLDGQRDQLTTRVRVLEGELALATEQAEALRLELEEANAAIEEIRQSIVEVGAHSVRVDGGT